MAVAAYASLASLTHVLDNVEYRVHLRRLHLDVEQIHLLQKNVDSLFDLLEQLHSTVKNEAIQRLWRQMVEVAAEFQNIFDMFVVSQLSMMSEIDHLDCSSFYQDLDRLTQTIVSIKHELLAFQDLQTINYVPVGSSSTLSSSANNAVVGFDGHLEKITDMLTRDSKSGLQILPITGMGGIGKTTLAKSVLLHPYIADHFDMHLWLTISQDYSIKEILLGLLNDGQIEKNHQEVHELGDCLRKKLFGRRYLVVMDDLWSSEAWDVLRRIFPNNSNGSWIIVTTRLSNLVVSLGFKSPYQMDFLNEDLSWDLFCQRSFLQKVCPYPELEKVGKKIAKRCRGLPIAIVTIGSLLAKSNMTREYWEHVAEKMHSFADLEDGVYCLNILSLSYNNLPLYLKPCFLYMSAFREDEYVDVSKLIRLWICEGFIRPVSNKSLEEIATEYFKDLIDRSLMIMDGWTRGCGIHDLLRDICIRECDKELLHFFPSHKVVQSHNDLFSWINIRGSVICCLCGRSIRKKEMNLLESIVIPKSASQSCLLACGICVTMSSPTTRQLRFVRAIDLVHYRSSIGLAHSTQLRRLSIRCPAKRLEFISPTTLHLLWNLQSLSICVYGSSRRAVVLPPEIWEMPQLREIDIDPYALLYLPESHFEQKDFYILRNLKSLSCIKDFECRKEIIDRIPYLRNLKIKYSHVDGEYSLCNLIQLQKLETLNVYKSIDPRMSFPDSLKQLVLKNCKRIAWKDMTAIGSLPNLEKLTLWDTTEGTVWNPIEGEFQRLKRLMIGCANLVWWIADWIHFPNLEHLELKCLDSLEEIPSGIGDIPMLHSIYLEHCSDSVINSAQRILDEQLDMENQALKITIIYPVRGGRIQARCLEAITGQ